MTCAKPRCSTSIGPVASAGLWSASIAIEHGPMAARWAGTWRPTRRPETETGSAGSSVPTGKSSSYLDVSVSRATDRI